MSLFRSARPVPADLRSNFNHLFLDIAWFGVLAASAMSFVAVFAARQGANAFQLGFLSASPAVVNLVATLPAGRWLGQRNIGSAVFWAAALHRFFYLLWIPLPLLLAPQGQIWALIGLTLLMSIPGAALAVGFNALFADAVPADWRGYVAGRRNALLSVTFILVSLASGQILGKVPFPLNYQIIFGMGAIGAAVSTYHLRFVTPLNNNTVHPSSSHSMGDLARPGVLRTLADSLKPGIGLRYLMRQPRPNLRRVSLLRGTYGKVVAILAFFHLAVHLAIPIFPLHWVNYLHLSDQQIGLGTAVFYASVFAGSTQVARLAQRWGNQRATAVGAMLMATYPALTALSQGFDLFLVASVIGGLGWSLVGGTLANYLLEKIPEDHRPAYLAWYNLALNAALLAGALIAPLVSNLAGVLVALGLSAVLRLVAAILILRWE